MKKLIQILGSLLGLLLLTTLLGACGDANEEVNEEEAVKAPGILPVEKKEEDEDLGFLHY